MANVTLRLVKGTPLTNSEVDNNFSNLNITKTEIGGDLGGNVFFPTVTGLQGRSVSNVAPSNAQVLSWSVSSNSWVAANAVASYTELSAKPAINVVVTGDITGSANILLANTTTNILTINTTYQTANFDSRYLKLVSATPQIVAGPLTFEGNVSFTGNVTTISANNLIISDNFIYLNDGNNNTSVDFGIVGNYNDGTYAHAGIFRDASDSGIWKIFEGYTPEPDANVNIDTANASFRLANLQINTITANTLRGISNTSVVTNLNADFLDGQHGSYYSDYTNQTNKPAANVILTGDVSGTANVSLGSGTNQISISTTIQANSVALGIDTVGTYVGNILTGGNVTVSVSGDEGANVTISIPQAIGSNANVTFNNVTGSNAIISPNIYGTNVYSGGYAVWTSNNDGAGSGLDADLLDGLNSTYFTNYNNQNNKPSANIVISGTISGSANVLLNGNTNIVSISTSINNDTVTLGTHTVGSYTDKVLPGSGITVSGTVDEGNVITVSHADTSGLLGLVGSAGIANITVDTYGHIIAANTATYLTTESDTFATVTGRGAITTTAITINAASGNAITTTGNISVDGALVWTAKTDGAGSGLDADLLDGQQGTYFLDYVNATNRPAANVVLSGNLLGSGNVLLGSGTNILTVSARVADDSVTLGTHTVGRFVANVEAGTAIEVSGGGAENAVTTVSHADTSTLAGVQGGSGISSITVDGLGHVTAVSAATYLVQPGLNVIFTGDVAGSGNLNITNSGTNTLSIGLTVQPDSVALGTDTTGNYVNRVIGGTGISATGTVDEGNVITVGLTSTGVVANTYGNARIIPAITVDAQGRITSASNVTFASDVANIALTGDVTGTANAILTPNSTVLSLAATLASTGVTANTYGNARIIPSFTVDAKGRLTAASNIVFAPDVANVVLTGDVAGSANVILGPNSTTISIATTVQPNSVALGTDTTGNYVDRAIGGAGISVTGTADEGNVLTVNLTLTGVTASTYGNASIVPVLTVDTQGRITAASNAVIDYTGITNKPASNIALTGDVTGSANAVLTANSTVLSLTTTLASSGVAAATYGNARIIPSFTVDSKGRITSASNVTFGSDVANIVLTGDVTGTANAILGPNSTTITINTTVGPNSVALGIDTTGNYVDRVVGGTGVSITGTADEGNVLTASLTSTGVVANTYGNASIIPVFTVDAQGRITSASNVAIASSVGSTSNTQLLFNNNGTIGGNANLTWNGSILSTYLLNVTQSAGDEGGEIQLAKPQTNTTLSGSVVVDIYQNKLRFFESSGTNRGFYVDITSGNASAGTNLVASGTGGTTNYPDLTNKPAANIILSGDATGTANAVLTANTTLLSLSTTLASTGVGAATYGNARIIPSFAVDAKGRLTAASNIAFAADVANIVLTGDVTGSANVILGPNTTTISIATTVAADSVALGTDTTGNYVDRVVAGTGILTTGTADEGNVITVGLTTTGVSAATYGNATIVPVFTVDAQGRITTASNVSITGVPSSDTLANITARGNVTSDTITLTNTGNSLIASGNIQTSGNIIATTGNIFAQKLVSTANAAFYVDLANPDSIEVAGNVYTSQRIGWNNVNSTASVVYQFYNPATNSLDTVFG